MRSQYSSSRTTGTQNWIFAIICVFAVSLTGGVACSDEVDDSDQASVTDEQIFDSSRLLEVDVRIAKDDWDSLRYQTRNFALALRKPPPPSPYSWFKADVTINGQVIESVGIRKKGFIGSQDSERPSLKIKFDEFVEQAPIRGLDRLTLNNNKQDRGFVSQSVSYKLFRDANLPASRCTLARVTVNGELLGIYTNVESVKKSMLKRNFGDADGKLYEGTVADLFPGKIDALEAKLVDENDTRTELSAVADLVSAEDVDMETLEQHLDIDEFLRFWAMESLIGFWDGYTNNQNNYFVYAHAGDSKLHFMPWGVDAALSYEGGAKMFKSGPESVHTKSLLSNRLYHTEGVADRYRETMRGLLKESWDEEALIAEIDRIEDLVEDSVHGSQRDYARAMEEARNFIRSRRRIIEREFRSWPRRVSREPRTPFYSAKIGEATGTFTTRWLASEPSDPYGEGTAELQLTIDGEKVRFSRLGVYATYGKEEGFGRRRRPTIVFVGKRQSNKIKVTMSVGAETGEFKEPSGDPASAAGALIEGIRFWEMRIVGGSVTLDEAGMEAGDTVRGSLTVDIVQFKGRMR